MTFGGAYAVLAYVLQAAVQSYHWITQHQAIDGLGLAETTPGPLIMVLQFVGFMTGWNRPEGMSRLASASLGAVVTTYVTFLPCFFYIFLGAPYVESLRGNRSLTVGALRNHGRRGRRHPESRGRLRPGRPASRRLQPRARRVRSRPDDGRVHRSLSSSSSTPSGSFSPAARSVSLTRC